MALVPETAFPGQIKPSTAAWPFGEAQNITSPGDGKGTPWRAILTNDLFGLQQSLLSAAGITPNGQPDSVENPQYLTAIRTIIGSAQDQITEVKTYPADFSKSASTTAPYNIAPVGTMALRDAAEGKIYGIAEGPVSGEITALDFTEGTATIGGTDVSLGGGLDRSRVSLVGAAVSRSLQERFAYSIEDWGAPCNGVDDDAPFFALAFNFVKAVKLPDTASTGKQVNIKSAMPTLQTNYSIEAEFGGFATILVNADIDLFPMANNARNITLRNFSAVHQGTSTKVAIKPDPTQGGEGHRYENVTVTNFEKALQIGDVWFGNSVIDFRCNNCNFDIDVIGTGGQNIQNTFINYYSNKPRTRGLQLRACKEWTFITPNFGSDLAGVGGMYGQFSTNCRNIKLINANFEGEGTIAIPAGSAGITVLGDSDVTLDGVSFDKNVGQAATAYLVQTRDTARCLIKTPIVSNQGANMGRYQQLNDSQIRLEGAPATDVDNQSTRRIYSIDNVVETGFLTEGEELVAVGGLIQSDLGRIPEHVEVDIVWSGDTRATVTVNVSDRFTNGTFKLRFTDQTTGGAASGSYTVHWKAK